MSTKSQKAAILKYMLDGNSISQAEAAEMFGCWRLGARCYDLREDGIKVVTQMSVNIKTGKRFARYYIPHDERKRLKQKKLMV